MSEILEDFARWIKSNGLSSKIPVEIDKLEKLSVLDLSKSKLRELPQSIGFLPNLSVLKLSNNRLKELPKTIGNLKKLRIHLMRADIENAKKTTKRTKLGGRIYFKLGC